MRLDNTVIWIKYWFHQKTWANCLLTSFALLDRQAGLNIAAAINNITLSEETVRAKRNLLIPSAIGAVMLYADKIPSGSLPFWGKVGASDVNDLNAVLSVFIAYFLLRFTVYVLKDVARWEHEVTKVAGDVFQTTLRDDGRQLFGISFCSAMIVSSSRIPLFLYRPIFTGNTNVVYLVEIVAPVAFSTYVCASLLVR